MKKPMLVIMSLVLTLGMSPTIALAGEGAAENLGGTAQSETDAQASDGGSADLEQLIVDYKAKKAASDAANAEKTKAEAAVASAQKTVTAAEETLNSATEEDQANRDENGVSYDYTIIDFFKAVGSTDAEELFYTATYKSDTHPGYLRDATASHYVFRSLDFIDKCNQLRKEDPLCTKNEELLVTDQMMAMAALNANRAVVKWEHSMQFSVGENLAWGFSDPFSGWYSMEKKAYEAGNTSFAGHYLNIVSNNYKCTGFAIAEGSVMSQVFDGGWRLTKEDQAYTVAEWRARYNKWYQSLKGIESEKVVQARAALADAQATLKEKQDALVAPTAAADKAAAELSAAETAYCVAVGLKPTATKWNRQFGEEALDTMEAIVKVGWSGETGGTVVLATDAGYWDALTAAGAAGFTGAPVLMTAPDTLSPQTVRLLKTMRPAKIIVCGGPAVVRDNVVKAAEAASGGKAKRFFGQTMTDTADEVFKGAAVAAGGTWSRTAFVATSNGYWDALAAAPISYTQHMPIFLTESRARLSDATIAAMKGKVDQVIIVGGSAVVAPSVETQLKAAGIKVLPRLAGETAIDTSVKVAEYGVKCGMSPDNMGVATQNGYWDALAGAALCGKKNAVLVLVDQEDSASIKGFAGKHSDSIATGYVFGGRFAVSEAVFEALQAATPKPDVEAYIAKAGA